MEGKVKERLGLVFPIVAMVLIYFLECYAISKGIDGRVLTLSIGAIAGLGGYQLSNFIRSLRR